MLALVLVSRTRVVADEPPVIPIGRDFRAWSGFGHHLPDCDMMASVENGL